MLKITTEIDRETNMKLIRRANRVGMTPVEAVKFIAQNGVKNFLALLVGATK